MTIQIKRVFLVSFLFIFYGCSYKDTQIDKQKLLNTINMYYVNDLHLDNQELLDDASDISTILKKLDKFSLYINNTTHKPVKIYYEKYTSRVIKKNILYIKIPYFDKNVTKNITNSIKNSDPNIKKIILDLRNNPGGYLPQAIQTANLFVDEGLLLTIRKKNKYNSSRYFATKESTLTNLPLYVLVNNRSASSAEIVAGILKYHKRATLIGEKTYGKNTIQAMIYLNSSKTEALRLSIGKYYFLDKIENTDGVEVDITIKENTLFQDRILTKTLLLLY